MKFYLPILLLLLVSVTSLHKKRKGFFRDFLQRHGMYPHSDYSIDMKLPNQKSDITTTFTYKGLSKSGIVIKLKSRGIVPEEYAKYFDTKPGTDEMLLPYPYIKAILNENHGHPSSNLHCMITPNLKTESEAKISFYLPEESREAIIKKVKYNVESSQIVGMSMQLHSRLLMLNDQFKDKCPAAEEVKGHLFELILKSEIIRDAVKNIKEEKRRWTIEQIYDYKQNYKEEELQSKCKKDNVEINQVQNDDKYTYFQNSLLKIGTEGLKEAKEALATFFYDNHINDYDGLSPTLIYQKINKLFKKNELIDLKFKITETKKMLSTKYSVSYEE